ncbi:hypothetical protein LEN26_008599 [Aphanomyces euteiches]|nr:hypothetical protein AeMF1_010168 [Aphanomyces euteiches]KAH9130365.1 hypothetical protein LEN26_008599 [Aphanomyces euteiches]KAH9192212.1 hypothetical protein AeNC1_005812 [Aphanomyces euteiches]
MTLLDALLTPRDKLKCFLVWLTLLSLTSFFFHPDGMLCALLVVIASQIVHLFEQTVALWRSDPHNTSSTAVWYAAIAWSITILTAIAFGQLCSRWTNPLSSVSTKTNSAIKVLPGAGFDIPLSTKKRIPKRSKKQASTTRGFKARTLVSNRQTAFYQDIDDNQHKPNMTVAIEETSPPTSPLPPPTPTLPETPLDHIPIDLPPLEFIVDEPVDIAANDEEPQEEEQDYSTVSVVTPDVLSSDDWTLVQNDDDNNNPIEEEPPSGPAVLDFEQLLAFLRDPKVTASAIRVHVASGEIDVDLVLSTPQVEFANVPPLVMRMLFIAAMAAKNPQSKQRQGTISPPPGFSAIPSYEPRVGRLSGRFKSARPRSTTTAPLHDNQYEQEMELISNQMTMNVLD